MNPTVAVSLVAVLMLVQDGNSHSSYNSSQFSPQGSRSRRHSTLLHQLLTSASEVGEALPLTSHGCVSASLLKQIQVHLSAKTICTFENWKCDAHLDVVKC